MQSKATTVRAYLDSLPADRRAALEAVRKVILANLDPKFAEGMTYGMIGYFAPHSVYPDGYHCDPKMPLPYAGLASQKHHMSLYLMGLYVGCEPGKPLTPLTKWFQDAWQKTGKKLDMGKACIRFKKLEDVPLDVVGEAFRRLPADAYIATYDAVLAKMGKGPKASSGAAASGAKKSTTGAAKTGGAKKAASTASRTAADKSTSAKPAAKSAAKPKGKATAKTTTRATSKSRA